MYYKIIPDYDKIGAIPQASYTSYFDMSLAIFDDKWKCPDFKMEKGAKLTDYIFHIGEGYASIVSNTFFDTVRHFKMADHQKFDVKIIQNKKEFDHYSYLHFILHEKYFDYVDWTNSIFYKYFNHTEQQEKLSFGSYSELDSCFQRFLDTPYTVGGEVRLKDMDIDVMQFRLPFFPIGLICSQKCKEALENSPLSGFLFEELG